ncbi:serine/threonine-protein kinase [Urbifossiella limnaea]|uniref:Serine/threonine-protein kinase PknB n=1 Tax=Urbifossiella limnaea TaxID=2528023 RepID=A0A517XZC4_9BACT|nr:serine/threonine-protein kinase [Urbifossiella limnaea]QDU22865.1 Serine/threonine-protein kinase PknB [Urbifossiella limnaea]
MSSALHSDGEGVIRQFENAWRAGRPDLAAFLPTDTPPPTELLLELVHVDLEFRFRSGDDARVEDYLPRFPALAADALLLDLIRAEFALRGRHRPPAAPDDFARRFPEHASEFVGHKKPGPLSPTRPAGPSAEPLTVAPTIPGYAVVAELGRGGMGVVYKADDLILRRTVALKTLGSVPAADSKARFAREAEAIAALDHPHIVPVYEVGEWTVPGMPPVPFFVMKYYPGGSLDAAPAGPGTDPAAQARTVEVIARAVHHAHQRGILHRDLKPSNILLDDAGWPHVADFGLAGRFDPTDPRTLTAEVVGTPAYMSPEQARSPKEVTVAADVYGLGAVLYHQFTGKPPFVGATPLSTLELVANAAPERPTAVNPAVPRDLETICLKCLEKEPARRYATALDFADDLERWRTGRPVLARPTPGWEHGWRWARRHPVVAAMGAVTAAALLLAVGVLARSNAEIQAKERETHEAYLRECALKYKLSDALAREQQTLYLERVASAGRLVSSNQLPQAWKLLDQCPPEHRGWEWKYLDGLRRAAPPALTGHDAWVAHVVFLGDGNLLSLDNNGTVRVWNPAGATVRTWALGPERAHTLAAHPTRPWVAVCDPWRVTVWDAAAGQKVKMLPADRRAAFSPCGRWVALAAGRGVRLVRADDWKQTHALAGHAADVRAMTFSADGKQLYTGDIDGVIRRWDAATGEVVGEPWQRPRAVAGLAFSGDNRWLLEAHSEGVVVVDPATGRHVRRVAPTAPGRTLLAACPVSDRLAVVGPDREVMVWECGGGAGPVCRGHAAKVSALAFSRDGRRLASAGGDQTVRVWNPAHEPGVSTVANVRGVGSLAVAASHVAVTARAAGLPPGVFGVMVFDPAGRVRTVSAVGDCAASPDGTHFAAGLPDGGMTLWDATSGAPAWAHADPDVKALGTVMRLAVAPGGKRVAARPAGGQIAGSAVRVWDATGRGVDLLVGERFLYALAFSPDGTRLAAATAGGAGVWDADTGQRQPWADGPREAYAVAFAPEGDRVAVSEAGAVRVREVKAGAVVQSFVGSPLRVNAVAFSPDGSRLLTGGADGTVRVWDVASGQELLTLTASDTEEATAVAWVGGRVYAAVGGAVRVWSPPAE